MSGCTEPHQARGFCASCYARARRHNWDGEIRVRGRPWTKFEDGLVLAVALLPSGHVRKGEFQRVGRLLDRSADGCRQRRTFLAEKNRDRGAWRPSEEALDAMQAEAQTMHPAGARRHVVGLALPPEMERKDAPRPARPCARCSQRFLPTMQRRLLCAFCYSDDDRDSTLHIENRAALSAEAGIRLPRTLLRMAMVESEPEAGAWRA